MSERRSSRQRRTVDYRQFADRASDDDDDFESSPAPHKKAKPQQQGREGARTSTDGAVAQREQDCEVRPSRDERKFSRDTEKALRKSEIPASTESSDGHPSPPLPACGDTVRNGKDGDYEPEDGEEREEEEEFVSGPGESSDNDFSVSSPPRKKTKPAARQTAKTKRSSTTALKTEVTQRGRGRGEREKTVNCKPATLACRTKQGSVSKPTSQPSHTLPSTNNTCTVKSPLPGTPGLGMRRMPRWTPPGPSGRENIQQTKPAINNGGTPVVRVGLSRNARVKPLHNSCHNS